MQDTPGDAANSRHSRAQRRTSVTIRFEGRAYLAAQPVDAALVQGARNAVVECIGLGAGRRLLLIVESGCEDIGSALLMQAEEAGAETSAYVVDAQHAEREAFVDRVARNLEQVDASILVARGGGLSPRFCKQMIPPAGSPRRHLQMVGVTPAIMAQAMRGDYDHVHLLGERLRRMLRGDSTLHITTATGTRLKVHCDPAHRWHNASGLQREPGWSSLPGGELLTCPASVDGVLVPDGGAWLPDGREIGRTGRLRLRFEQGRLVDVSGAASDALQQAVDGFEGGRRVGIVGFGTNRGVLTPIGLALQDLKMPGLHLALGHPHPELTGADWAADAEIPLLPRRADVTVDDTPILVRGRYARTL